MRKSSSMDKSLKSSTPVLLMRDLCSTCKTEVRRPGTRRLCLSMTLRRACRCQLPLLPTWLEGFSGPSDDNDAAREPRSLETQAGHHYACKSLGARLSLTWLSVVLQQPCPIQE